MNRLLAVALLLSAACGSPTPAPNCSRPDAGPVSDCELAQTAIAVEVDVAAWAPQARAMALTGYPDGAGFTPVSLNVRRVLRGPTAGRFDALVRGCIDASGMSGEGPLAGKSGYVLMDVADDDYYVVHRQGWFWRDGAALRNLGSYAGGIDEADFLSRFGGSQPGPSCGGASGTPDAGG